MSTTISKTYAVQQVIGWRRSMLRSRSFVCVGLVSEVSDCKRLETCAVASNSMGYGLGPNDRKPAHETDHTTKKMRAHDRSSRQIPLRGSEGLQGGL